jgi:uncharacterized protein YjbJ (UPF0337 family)
MASNKRAELHNQRGRRDKGAANKVKGAIKDTAGKVTGDEKMQAEGKMDKAKGAAHNAVAMRRTLRATRRHNPIRDEEAVPPGRPFC